MILIPIIVGLVVFEWLLCLAVIVDASRHPDAAWRDGVAGSRSGWIALAALSLLVPLPGLGVLVPALYLATGRPDRDGAADPTAAATS